VKLAVGVKVEVAAGVAGISVAGKRRFVGEFRRQGQFLRLVEIEELLWSLERDMRFLKPDGEEERLRGGVVVFEELDGLIGVGDVRCPRPAGTGPKTFGPRRRASTIDGGGGSAR
jgi:hypothetical protein